jgi:transposase-like protein
MKDEFDRILITHESESENKDEAKKFLEKIKKAGVKVSFAFSDYSKSFTESIKEVFPDAKFQADHFHSAKNIWKHLRKCFLQYRREIKEDGENENNEQLLEIASKLWKLRWKLLKKPKNLSKEERAEIEALEEIQELGFLKKFRAIIKQIANLFDHSNTELQAKIKLNDLKNRINETENKHLKKISDFLDAHWVQAMQYLRKKGLGKYKRSSNSES